MRILNYWKKLMREDYAIKLKEMFPRGFVLTWATPANTVLMHLFNPEQIINLEIIAQAIEKLPEQDLEEEDSNG